MAEQTVTEKVVAELRTIRHTSSCPKSRADAAAVLKEYDEGECDWCAGNAMAEDSVHCESCGRILKRRGSGGG